jgi:fructose-1-phosphate kinase PfkB-like protein
MLREKLRYLATAADVVIFAGSLPRGVEDNFYGDLIRELNKRSIGTVLDAEGEPLRMGTAAEPFLVSPNQREAESLVGQEFHEDQDFIQALDDIAELGARNVLITQESGCFALLREEREVKRLRAVAPEVEPASTVGSGDVLLSAFLAARDAGKPIDEALRSAVAAGAASTLEVGAGRFDPREASRLAGGVEVTELEPVVS